MPYIYILYLRKILNLLNEPIVSDLYLSVAADSECEFSSVECPDDQECVGGKCENSCFVTTCGRNAKCYAKNNHGVCKCWTGFVGDPYKGCQRGQIIF